MSHPDTEETERILTELDDVTIETLVQGPAGNEVVIIPSYGRDGVADFDHVARALAGAGHRVWRPQPRGVGASAGPMEGVSLAEMAGDVASVLERNGVGPAVVVGHAFGNFVARALATVFPQRVAATALVCAQGTTVAPEVAAAPFRAGDPSLSDADRLEALRLAFFAPGHDATVWLDGWYPETLRMQRAAIESADLHSYWGGGDRPLIEVIAADDPFHQRSEWGQMRANYGERVSTTVVEHASHALFPEQPEAVADTLVAAFAPYRTGVS